MTAIRRFTPRAPIWLIQTLRNEKAHKTKWTLKMVVLCGSVAFIRHKMWRARTKPFPRLASKSRKSVWVHFTIVHKSNESNTVDMTTFPVFFSEYFRIIFEVAIITAAPTRLTYVLKLTKHKLVHIHDFEHHSSWGSVFGWYTRRSVELINDNPTTHHIR